MNILSKYLICILCSFNAFVFSSSSLVVESNHISDMIQYLSPGTLIILDIDNTVLAPAQSLGSDQWAWDRVKQLKSKLTDQEAKEKTSNEWFQVHSITKVKTIEESTADLIKSLQSKMYTLFALTTRSPAYAEITLRELDDVGINFSVTSLLIKNCDFIGKNILFKEGIVFTSLENRKGDVLQEILKNNSYCPQKIIFVDDKLSHVKDVADACMQLGIDFVGLRYGAADADVASFDRDIAETQQFFMNHILNDTEAAFLKKIPGDHHE